MWGRPSGPPPGREDDEDDRRSRHYQGGGFPGQGGATYGGQSAYGRLQDSYGRLQESYERPQESYGYERPSYERPPESHGYERPSYERPPESYGYERPSYERPPESYGYERHESHGYERHESHGYERHESNNSYDSYSRPNGPPPGFNVGNNTHNTRPHNYSEFGNFDLSSQSSYQRPPGPPPGWTQEQVQEQANSVSVFEENDHDVYIQEAYNVQAPSHNPQQFSSQVQGYNYKYSSCTGKRKALLIGINYIGTKNQLRGCINDVNNVSRFLQQHGYNKSDIVILTDDQSNVRALPKKQNIIDAMRWLVKGAEDGDSLFFHYSGHGGQVEDQDGDEYDGYDECIYPMDFESAGEIIDDVMHEIMVRPLPPGCRLTALFDCCHSGSILDLPYTYSTKGVEKEPNVAAEAGEGLLSAVTSYITGDKLSALTKAFDAVGTFMEGSNNTALKKTKQTKTSPADVIMLSGCKDDQTSADASEGGQATGAMSYAFIKVMNSGKRQSFLSLLQNTREVLAGKYQQKPQLTSSHPIDVNLQFIF